MPLRKIWSKEEEAYLKEHHLDKTRWEIAEHIGVSVPTVTNKMLKMGLELENHASPKRVWSDEEIRFLKDNFAMMSAVDIADHLGLNSVLVSRKARELGLKKSPEWDRRQYYHRYVGRYKNNTANYKFTGV